MAIQSSLLLLRFGITSVVYSMLFKEVIKIKHHANTAGDSPRKNKCAETEVVRENDRLMYLFRTMET